VRVDFKILNSAQNYEKYLEYANFGRGKMKENRKKSEALVGRLGWMRAGNTIALLMDEGLIFLW